MPWYSGMKQTRRGNVQLGYNYRLYPSPGQRAARAKAFGCARVVFNDALRLRQDAHAAGRPFITDSELSARLTAMKATPQRAWLAGRAGRVPRPSPPAPASADPNFVP